MSLAERPREPIDIAVNLQERDGQQLVGIKFGKKISWFGLTATEAETFANFILTKVSEIRSLSRTT